MSKFLTLTLLLIAFSSDAAIRFFTDYPNGAPLDSDFFVYQRNQTYGNASGAQVKFYILANPLMTGNGSISGNWVIGGVGFGDGSGFTNLLFEATNTFINIVTNNTFVNTNVLIVTSNAFFNNTTITNANITNVTFQVGKGGKLTVTNAFFTFITNNFEITTNLTVENITNNIAITTNLTTIINTNNTFVNTNVLIVTSNSFFNNQYVTNQFVNITTNNTFVNTNIFISTSNAFFNNTYVTNLTVQNITNVNEFTTNLTVQNITNTFEITTNLFVTTNNVFQSFVTNETVINNFSTNLYTTNLTIIQPGGATNLNLTPNSLMYSDANDAETSLANTAGFLVNLGNGGPTDIHWTNTLVITEIDAQNAYLTNTFVFITNSPVLATDGNGKLTNGAPLAGTNVLISPGANIVFTTNSGNITIAASGVLNAQVYASNVVSGGVLASNTLSATAGANGWMLGQSNAAPVWTLNAGSLSNLNGANLQGGTVANTALANSSITIQGSAVALGGSTLAAGSSPAFNAVNFTNWNGAMPTNNGNGAALVFGGPSTATASILYETNITAATTLAAFDITHTPSTASGIKLIVGCTGGTDRVLTFPGGCTGAGLGTPPAVTITNGTVCWFDIIFKPAGTLAAQTNVFRSPVF